MWTRTKVRASSTGANHVDQNHGKYQVYSAYHVDQNHGKYQVYSAYHVDQNQCKGQLYMGQPCEPEPW
jgi:hypothetical protein